MKKIFKNKKDINNQNSYFYFGSNAIWSDNDYNQKVHHAYIKNPISHRAISLVARAAASINLKVLINGKDACKSSHAIAKIMKAPNPMQSIVELMQEIYIYRHLHGNAYLLGAFDREGIMREIYSIKPERVNVIPGENFFPKAYEYVVENNSIEYPVNQENGKSAILHIKNFHPLSDLYGMPETEVAMYSIEQHNKAAEWNQSLLKNGARPSGIIVAKDSEGKPVTLNQEQLDSAKETIKEYYSGSENVGRVLVMHGGFEWQNTSFSHKDIDFIECKHSAARDIALAFGIPPQLLGIPGDNTYNNLRQAYKSFWSLTVFPLVDNTTQHMSRWFSCMFDERIEITYTKDIESKIDAEI